jgi:hypothetical protein
VPSVVKKMAWLYMALTIAAGAFFYWLRGRCRWVYGIVEIAVALLIIFLIWFPHGYRLLSVGGETFWDIFLSKTVSIFVGVYAFVRGCDNLIGGLREPNV